MIAIFLAIAITVREPLPLVDVCEINQTRHIKQVILYRWSWLSCGRGHHVSQWWTFNDDPDVQPLGDYWIVSSEGRRFLAKRVRKTETPYDPEVLDRKKLNEADRIEYIK